MADKLGLGQGKKTFSWIWTSTEAIRDGSNMDLHEGEQSPSLKQHAEQLIVLFAAVHIEWAKAHAQYLRWMEEVMFLKKEMHQVCKMLEWKAMWWEQH